MPSPRRGLRRTYRILGAILIGVILLCGVTGAACWMYLRASLPQLDGSVAAPGLAGGASILRDDAGRVTITAGSRLDAAYATGYAQAQDRYFQMDVLRRSAAGELAALFGPNVLLFDERTRVNRFRAHAEAAAAALRPEQRALLDRYTAGVNAGLAALGAPPFEYAALRLQPRPWRPEDSLLVVYAMYMELQGDESTRLLSREALRAGVPADLYAFLTPTASHWDVPLDGVAAAQPPYEVPATRPDWLDKAPRLSSLPPGATAALPGDDAVGSNSFAVDGRHGADGQAMVANDMHLRLSLPNIWYRLTLVLPGKSPAGDFSPAGGRTISGVSLPGTPVVVAGSNGDVAWGFTNSYGRYMDLVRVERDPRDATRYRGPSGEWETLVNRHEVIHVHGRPDVDLIVPETRWGPLLKVGKRAYAVRWIAYRPDAADLGLQGMEDARTLDEALHVAQAAGVPTQNILVADRQGHIGWTLAGPLPAVPLDPRALPVAAASVDGPIDRLAPDAYPRVVDPPGGLLWTANNTQLGDAARQRRIGDGGADVGMRATQIRDELAARPQQDARALLGIQLDDRALWLQFWREQALDALDDAALRGHVNRAAFKRILQSWNGRADPDAAGYTLARGFYLALYETWFGVLDERIEASADDAPKPLSVGRASSRLEPVMEALARKHAWAPARFANWNAFMLDRIDAVIQAYTGNGGTLEQADWGGYNRLAMGHPFTRLMPEVLRPLLSAPATRMPGDNNMPRVQGRSFGASERFVVAPGREDTGVMEMPGGASGHPLSPFFLAGHLDWVGGVASPFLPGPAVHRLDLAPPAEPAPAPASAPAPVAPAAPQPATER
jgi:penicillin amidase